MTDVSQLLARRSVRAALQVGGIVAVTVAVVIVAVDVSAMAALAVGLTGVVALVALKVALVVLVGQIGLIRRRDAAARSAAAEVARREVVETRRQLDEALVAIGRARDEADHLDALVSRTEPMAASLAVVRNEVLHLREAVDRLIAEADAGR